VDVEGLKKDVEAAGANTGEFVEVPKGDYEVKVVKLEIGETGEKSKTPGMPMAKVWFEVIAGEFKQLKSLFDELKQEFGEHFDTLSMGMTSDYPLAIECGSTMVRIGSQIFGERNY
ncbi:MAG: hypothetical protein J6V31_03980, partial [Tidjanibacter sp.]|nr:hypothetical protein [Tidjanibacter sp.]